MDVNQDSKQECVACDEYLRDFCSFRLVNRRCWTEQTPAGSYLTELQRQQSQTLPSSGK